MKFFTTRPFPYSLVEKCNLVRNGRAFPLHYNSWAKKLERISNLIAQFRPSRLGKQTMYHRTLYASTRDDSRMTEQGKSDVRINYCAVCYIGVAWHVSRSMIAKMEKNKRGRIVREIHLRVRCGGADRTDISLCGRWKSNCASFPRREGQTFTPHKKGNPAADRQTFPATEPQSLFMFANPFGPAWGACDMGKKRKRLRGVSFIASNFSLS